jgi:hypothetical protein
MGKCTTSFYRQFQSPVGLRFFFCLLRQGCAMQPRLASNLKSSCLSLRSPGTTRNVDLGFDFHSLVYLTKTETDARVTERGVFTCLSWNVSSAEFGEKGRSMAFKELDTKFRQEKVGEDFLWRSLGGGLGRTPAFVTRGLRDLCASPRGPELFSAW